MRYRSNLSTVLVLLIALAVPLMGADGCGGSGEVEENVTEEQREQTEDMVTQAHDKVGMPQITEYSERRLLKRIMELRDGMIASHSYIVGENNNTEKLCQSMGYGLPYGVQFVNPEKAVIKYDHKAVSVGSLPQPDPNGLFSPRNVDATWVNCVTVSGEQKPVYSEEKVVTSPVPLDKLKGNTMTE